MEHEALDQQGIAIAVLSTSQDDVELVNRTLRDAGHAAHCTWVARPEALDEALGSLAIELIIVNTDRYGDTIAQVAAQKESFRPELPVIAVSETVDEDRIQSAMDDGACDLVSLDRTGRLAAVVARELRAFRLEQALHSTISSASAYRRQLQDYMEDSTTPIVYCQEGIVTDVNKAWMAMFGLADRRDVVGLPLMDFFESESQAAIKGAIVAASKGKWSPDDRLSVRALVAKGETSTFEVQFKQTKLEEGEHIQISVVPPEEEEEDAIRAAHEALKRDPTTLFFHRAQFLEKMGRRRASKPKSGLHVLVYIKPDHFSELGAAVGILNTEEIIAQFAEEVRQRLHPRDIAGRFEGTSLLALLERGRERDAEVWAQQLVDHVCGFDFEAGDTVVHLTCTVGICPANGIFSDTAELVEAVCSAQAAGRQQGGNRVVVVDSSTADSRLRKHDAIWVKVIKAALMENRFRLAQLPIAGLRSDSLRMFDLLVRMLDDQGKTVLPSEFLPVAERHDLMKMIDRWIVSAAMDFCIDHSADRVFVRMSRQSLEDASLIDWLQKELGRRGVDPGCLCVQVPEQQAAKFLRQTRKAIDGFHELGVAVALEHYGIDKNRFHVLDMLRPDYIKIDGELMHTLVNDTSVQDKVSLIVEAAQQREVETIAERVENANAMAILFQLGVNFMQGHYVHEPEVVLQEATGTADEPVSATAAQ